jgi:ferredoxin
MRVRIDAERCQGHLRCVGIAPALFAADDAGHAFAEREDVPPELAEAARIAVDSCPELAVILTEE